MALTNPLELAQFIEQYVSLGIFLIAAGLAALSFLAWQRERERKMAIVALGYCMFAVFGLVGFLEYLLLPWISYGILELAEHASQLLVLAGLLTFFIAVIRD